MLDVQAMPTDEDFSSELDDAIRREAAALSLSAGWSSSQLAGLVRSLSARAMLYIAPDFDKYVAQLDSLGTLATRPDSLELHGKPLTQERWTMYAEMTRPSAVGIDALELRFVFRDGAAVNQTARASHLSASDPGWYSRIDPHDPRTDVVELILPATLKDAEGTEFDGFLSFSVAWSKPHNKWVPFSTAITDPRGGDRFLMPPWF